jgi:uncharacterized protein YbjT (DUF2867 family)
MNIALTGGTGFIGSHILADLVAHDHDVVALVLRSWTSYEVRTEPFTRQVPVTRFANRGARGERPG